jgi:hypothetical protein
MDTRLDRSDEGLPYSVDQGAIALDQDPVVAEGRRSSSMTRPGFDGVTAISVDKHVWRWTRRRARTAQVARR